MKICSTCRTVRWPLPGGIYSCPKCDGAELIQNQGKWADAVKPDTELQRDVDEIIGNAVTCVHCERIIVNVGGQWIDPEATGDDSVWRETCDAHETFTAEHEPLSDAIGPWLDEGRPFDWEKD